MFTLVKPLSQSRLLPYLLLQSFSGPFITLPSFCFALPRQLHPSFNLLCILVPFIYPAHSLPSVNLISWIRKSEQNWSADMFNSLYIDFTKLLLSNKSEKEQNKYQGQNFSEFVVSAYMFHFSQQIQGNQI